jgi:hypothetical protein
MALSLSNTNIAKHSNLWHAHAKQVLLEGTNQSSHGNIARKAALTRPNDSTCSVTVGPPLRISIGRGPRSANRTLFAKDSFPQTVILVREFQPMAHRHIPFTEMSPIACAISFFISWLRSGRPWCKRTAGDLKSAESFSLLSELPTSLPSGKSSPLWWVSLPVMYRRISIMREMGMFWTIRQSESDIHLICPYLRIRRPYNLQYPSAHQHHELPTQKRLSDRRR